MNKQSKLTLFFLCSILSFKLGFVDMPVLTEHLATLHEKHELKRTQKIEQQKETVQVPDYALLVKTYLANAKDVYPSEGAVTVLTNLGRDNYGRDKSFIENPRCRDP